MPVRNDNRFNLKRAHARAYSEAVDAVLRSWPASVDMPSVQQGAALEVVAGKLRRAASMRFSTPWVSLKRDERETLWWLSYAMRSALGADAEPWQGIHALLWIDD